MSDIGRGKSALIVGAGLAGSLLAVYLARLGYTVKVYERRPDPRAAGYAGGRSINLALSARGLWGLAGVGIGLDKEVLRHAIPMRGRVMHSAASSLAFQPYSKDPADAINSISRAGLNLALIEAAARESTVELFFNHRCLDVDLDRPAAIFHDKSRPHAASSGARADIAVEADLILGADGAFSPVRGRMQKLDRFAYSQTSLEHGYKELHIPSAADLSMDAARYEGWAMDRHALHIWPRGGAMMIALPNPDRTFTCTLFWPYSGAHGFDRLTTREEVNRFFGEHYPDAMPLMPTLAEDFLRNPVASLVTIRCWPWVHLVASDTGARAVALLGDAAHAIVPFYGQGMNCAFEDVRILAELLSQSGGDLATALPRFQSIRKPDADAIADMALENFVEMRDKVGSRWFLWRKRLEHLLHDWFPSSMVPRYNLISFSTVPYTEARRQGEQVAATIRLAVATLAAMLVLLIGAVGPIRFTFAALVAAVLWFLISQPPSAHRDRPAQ